MTDGDYNQHFDVHGEGDGGYGGAGGTYFEIAFNTMRGDQGYYVVRTRPAFMQRGIPAGRSGLPRQRLGSTVRWARRSALRGSASASGKANQR